MSNKYYVVTAISQYRMRYAIPVEDLQDEDGNVSEIWAMDSVVMQEVEEFSQEHIGEVILDVVEEDEEQILARFDKENDYLKDWTTEHKLKHIRNWRYKS
jgi:predicted NAD/FAD-dependent oxidoreductase